MKVKSTKRSGKLILGGVCVLALAVAAPAGAQGKGKGPRASVASATTCAITDMGMLEVTTTLTNKSSGATTIPEVREGSEISATYKPANRRGNVNVILDTVMVGDLIALPADVDPELVITAEFDLCQVDMDTGMGMVRDEVLNARELNGRSTMNYGISGADGETRTVMNRCTDNPDTPENEGGIKVTDELIMMLTAACSMSSM